MARSMEGIGAPDRVIQLREHAWKYEPSEIRIKARRSGDRSNSRPPTTALAPATASPSTGWIRACSSTAPWSARRSRSTFKVDEPGRYNFYCSTQCSTTELHPHMHGVLGRRVRTPDQENVMTRFIIAARCRRRGDAAPPSRPWAAAPRGRRASLAADKVYVAPGEHDQYYGFLSGGQSGSVFVVGIPSGRLIREIPVFEPRAAYGYAMQRERSAAPGAGRDRRRVGRHASPGAVGEPTVSPTASTSGSTISPTAASRASAWTTSRPIGSSRFRICRARTASPWCRRTRSTSSSTGSSSSRPTASSPIRRPIRRWWRSSIPRPWR